MFAFKYCKVNITLNIRIFSEKSAIPVLMITAECSNKYF